MRDYLVYAIIETSFVKTDPRFRSLPATARWTYLCLWIDAFHHRRDTLPDWYDTAALHDTSGQDTRTCKKNVALLQQKCLIRVSPSGTITVCGVKGKGNIKWKRGGAKPSPKPRPKPSVLNAGSRVGVGVGVGVGVEKGKKPSAEPPEFLALWADYPRKEGRDGALKHCAKLVKDGTPWSELHRAVKNYARKAAESKTERQYIFKGYNFFGKGAWKDHLSEDASALPFGVPVFKLWTEVAGARYEVNTERTHWHDPKGSGGWRKLEPGMEVRSA